MFISRRILLACCFLQLFTELNSVLYLFLWPVNHSCALQTLGANSSAGNNNLTFQDSHNNSVGVEAIQLELINASPEDPLTAAQALVLNLGYEDISNCYEHPIFYDNQTKSSIVNTGSLETCRNGLRFEQAGLSLVAHFQLACSRQWLKVLLPLALASGYFLGTLSTFGSYYFKFLCVNNSWEQKRETQLSEQDEDERNLFRWILAQTTTIIFAFLCSAIASAQKGTDSANGSDGSLDPYKLITISVLLRSHLNASNIAGLLMSWGLNLGLLGEEEFRRYQSRREHENRLYVQICILTYLIIQAFQLPVAFKVFSNWRQLDTFLNVSSATLVLSIACFRAVGLYGWRALISSCRLASARDELELETRDQSDRLDKLSENNSKQQLQQTGGCQQIGFVTGGVEVFERELDGLSEREEPAKVCEFCLMLNEQSVYRQSGAEMWPAALRGPSRDHNGSFGGSMLQSIGGGSREQPGDARSPPADHSVMPTSRPLDDAYQPTTLPIWASERASSVGAVGCGGGRRQEQPSQFERSLENARGGRVRHNFRLANWSLANKPALSQLLRLLLFACLANYFLLQMLPNHSLLHSESMATRLHRKLIYHLTRGSQPPAPLVGGPAAINEPRFKYEIYGSPPENNIQEGPREAPFDYSNLNYSAEIIKLFRNSWNPFRLLYASADLNAWPLLLLVMLLHSNNLASLQASYFKLSHLFSWVKFAAGILLCQWLLIAILRGQKHLLESSHTLALAVLVSRLSACLMLYNYLKTLSKLARRLGPNINLMEYKPFACICSLAFALGSLVPILERLHLAIIPILLLLNNSLAFLVCHKLKSQFKLFLCPMMFEERPRRVAK